MVRFAVFTLLAVMLTVSCGTSVTGEYAYPVMPIKVESINIPQQIIDGETRTLNLTWKGGAETFTTTWIFGGGTLQTIMSTTGSEKESSVDVNFILDDIEPGTFNGMLQVIDERDNQLDYPFSYSVQANN